MYRFSWNKIPHRHHTQLFVTLIALFIVSPLVSRSKLGQIVIAAFFFIALAVGIRPFCPSSKKFARLVMLMAIGLGLQILNAFDILNNIAVDFSTAGIIIYCVFILFATGLIFRQVITDEFVTGDTIIGGICIYLLIGFLWGLFYSLAARFDSQAFNQTNFDTMYFSFTTLTTLGYGDISPTNALTRMLTNLEAIIGQMYPAIFIARLVSLYISPNQRS
ncbi:MAG: two pore domain potassium channel family protein [Cyanobacteria bacterium SID2]|nr:two pore domain potassium channel family protein [Cyanobacteria bacterium SID2]MBP0003348.1 two pore domain potassium channel family protein [Cyanobacteria bacterium SBC]